MQEGIDVEMEKYATFMDILWLKTFGLRSDNALEYFYTSPFFDSTSNNQTIRTQGVSLMHLIEMQGLEYALDTELLGDPSLFVIKKQLRKDRNSATLLDVYYCLDGVIYQSPILLDLLRSRFAKISYSLLLSFNAVKDNSRLSPAHNLVDDLDIDNDHANYNSNISNEEKVTVVCPTIGKKYFRHFDVPQLSSVFSDINSV